MNYSALIQNRKSTREFTDREITFGQLETIRNYYYNSVRRLIPEIRTELRCFGPGSGAALEGAAGYNQFLVGAPQYLVLLSEKHELAEVNAGYVMQDILLKLADMELDSCWLTFTDSDDVKSVLGIDSPKDVLVRFPKGWATRWAEMYAHLMTYRRDFRSNRWHDAPDVLTGIVEREAVHSSKRVVKVQFS